MSTGRAKLSRDVDSGKEGTFLRRFPNKKTGRKSEIGYVAGSMGGHGGHELEQEADAGLTGDLGWLAACSIPVNAIRESKQVCGVVGRDKQTPE